MPRQKEVEGYEDQFYVREEDLLAALQQAHEDLKYEMNGTHKWNKFLSDLEGITLKLSGNSLFLTYHVYKVCTSYELAMIEKDMESKKFLDEYVKNLKKKFKESTGETLKLEKEDDVVTYEKVSGMEADKTFMYGSNNYGYGPNSVGKFLIRVSREYKIDLELE